MYSCARPYASLSWWSQIQIIQSKPVCAQVSTDSPSAQRRVATATGASAELVKRRNLRDVSAQRALRQAISLSWGESGVFNEPLGAVAFFPHDDTHLSVLVEVDVGKNEDRVQIALKSVRTLASFDRLPRISSAADLDQTDRPR